MAEGIANKVLPNVSIESAGTEAHGVNPIAERPEYSASEHIL